ncbi:MAG: universal stress protein [Pseudomonadota bacterium]
MGTNDTLLVVIDNDDDVEALPCLARAVQLAQAMNAGIEVFCPVYDPYIAGERFFDSPDLDAAKSAYVRQMNDRMQTIAESVRAADVRVSVDVVWDAPVYEAIVRKVLRSRPLMVVRNNHYHHRLKRSIFSNDDWSLIRTCPAPLLITRPKRKDSEPLNVCAAIDPVHEHDKPAALDGKIFQQASDLATCTGGSLQVLHAYDPTPVIASTGVNAYMPVIVDADAIATSVRDQHRTAANRFAEQYALDAKQIALVQGSARKVIVQHAIEAAVDIMVMGAVSRGFLARALVGHTAEQVLDRMPCDVMIVKPDSFVTPVHAKSPHRFVDAA